MCVLPSNARVVAGMLDGRVCSHVEAYPYVTETTLGNPFVMMLNGMDLLFWLSVVSGPMYMRLHQCASLATCAPPLPPTPPISLSYGILCGH